MKFSNRHVQFYLVLLACTIFTHLQAQEMKVMTFNIRYATANDKENQWELRKEELADLLVKNRPDIFGIQEGLKFQLDFIEKKLKQYTYFGVAREDGKESGEYSPIFFDTTKYTLIEESTFWLAENTSCCNIGWDAAHKRICTYGLFKEKSSKNNFWVFNTHFDHKGEIARQKEAELILKQIEKINHEKFPVVLMGDFNALPDSEPILKIKAKMKDGLEFTSNDFMGKIGTFNNFDPNYPEDVRIDYIFVKDFEVLTYQHIKDKRKNGLFISDHFPVVVNIFPSNP
ncbi:endonuclease/exonuclease/phosphatase family protein [Namhaeicola litoreus]|uniref:Endonuclease/exonuclease/phosphatase family protein n=1 Tax=Namhaeicola litoreus TaxID=1052145 RepID=A0ABW3Y0K6_9FLAO